MRQISRLSGKYRVTVPTSARNMLQLKIGDRVGFEIEGNDVRLSRATPLNVAFTQALEGLLAERSSEEDDHAFKNL